MRAGARWTRSSWRSRYSRMMPPPTPALGRTSRWTARWRYSCALASQPVQNALPQAHAAAWMHRSNRKLIFAVPASATQASCAARTWPSGRSQRRLPSKIPLQRLQRSCKRAGRDCRTLAACPRLCWRERVREVGAKKRGSLFSLKAPWTSSLGECNKLPVLHAIDPNQRLVCLDSDLDSLGATQPTCSRSLARPHFPS